VTVIGLAHVNIATNRLEDARAFYVNVLGLTEGPRPPFKSRGYWLYAGSNPVVHLVEAIGLSPAPRGAGINHIAFETADIEAFAERLKKHGVEFDVSIVPGTGESQLNFSDPTGVRLEVNAVSDNATRRRLR
jgi:catechol 2,3-dioxygenase-like lactoylglutathione lyase family enzyme